MTGAVLAIGFILQCAVIGVWLYQQVAINRIRREGLIVETGLDTGHLPDVSIIVPARNEALRIGGCVESILSQSHVNLHLIIADDRSDDHTGAIARRAAGEDDRLSIERIGVLPAGWLGKSHAIWFAAKRARSDWLLLMDADCRMLPGGLAAALSYARRHDLDMLSLWPRDGSVGFWERLLIPLAGAMIAIWFGSPRVNDPHSPQAFANGQFILIRRSAYWAVGGHESVRDAIIEDIPFARRVKQAGYSVRASLGVLVYSVRMYASLGEIVRGWRRIYAGVLTCGRIALCIVSIVIGSLAPYVVLPVSLLLYLRSADPWAAAWMIASACHLVALVATSIRFFGLARCRLRYLWLYPLSCLGVIAILTSAFARRLGRRRETWRGTQYIVDQATIQQRR